MYSLIKSLITRGALCFIPLKVSDDNFGEDISDSYESDSLIESSSDEYTPYVRKRRGGGGRRGRRQGVSKS